MCLFQCCCCCFWTGFFFSTYFLGLQFYIFKCITHSVVLHDQHMCSIAINDETFQIVQHLLISRHRSQNVLNMCMRSICFCFYFSRIRRYQVTLNSFCLALYCAYLKIYYCYYKTVNKLSLYLLFMMMRYLCMCRAHAKQIHINSLGTLAAPKTIRTSSQ